MSKGRENEAEAIKILMRGGSFIKEVWEKYKPMERLSGIDTVKLQDYYGLSIFDITVLAYSHQLSIDFEEYYKIKDRVRKEYMCHKPKHADVKHD